MLIRKLIFNYRLMRGFVSFPRAIVKAVRMTLHVGGKVYIHHGW